MLMEKAPRDFKGIGIDRDSVCENDAGYGLVTYEYIDENGDFRTFTNLYNRHGKSKTIIEDPGKFTNGFKVVRLSDGLFAYIREDDGVLIEGRYCIASEFNDKGYAMVGKQNGVSFIDKNFNVLCTSSIPDCCNGPWYDPPSFRSLDQGESIDRFSDKVTEDFNALFPKTIIASSNEFLIGQAFIFNSIAFIGSDGKLKQFKSFTGNGGIIEKWTSKDKGSLAQFKEKSIDEKGTCFLDMSNSNSSELDSVVLFAPGYYLTFKDIHDLLVTSENDFYNSVYQSLVERVKKEESALSGGEQPEGRSISLKPKDGD